MRDQLGEILVPANSGTTDRLEISEQAPSRSQRGQLTGVSSLLVDRHIPWLCAAESERARPTQGAVASSPAHSDCHAPGRTIASHGLTRQELDRFSGAVKFMGMHCQLSRGRLWWVSTKRGSSRTVISSLQKHITKLQNQHRLPAYNAHMFEARGGLHAHIVFIGNADIANRLKASGKFDGIEVARVINPDGLAREYLAKERTSQAGYRREHLLGGRLRGSHRLEGGGDRVRLSRDLERDAIEAGYVDNWQHSNARRSVERKPYRPRPLTRRAPQLAGQLLLPVPEIERPVARLRQFGGGFVPPAVALEIEYRRQQHGLSQQQVAGMIGRSQGQFANAIRGHDPISSAAVNRLREILL